MSSEGRLTPSVPLYTEKLFQDDYGDRMFRSLS